MQPLSTRALVAYGAATLPLAISGLPLAIYIPPFYAQELGLDLTTVGVVLMLARVADVIIDPITGILSDRLSTRIGRRRPWVLVGTPIMMIGTWKLFVPPPNPSAWYLLGWVFVLYLGWSFLAIPYGAWGAELSTSYHERSRITGVREAFTVVGLIVAGVVPVIAGIAAGLAPGMRALAVTTVVLLPIVMLLLLVLVPESPAWAPPATLRTIGQGIAVVWRNQPFRRLLATSMVGGLAGSINATLAVLFFVHVVRIGAFAQGMILVYFVAGILALPFWLWLSRRTSKHRALCYAGLWGCSWFLLAPFLPAEQVLPVLVLNLMTGAVMAVPPTLGGSMAADVIDLDMFESGWGRAALFIALWSMGTKITIALGVGIAFPLLALFGFDPRGTNGSFEIGALAALYCFLPVALWLVSLVPIWNFPIDAERQAALRAAIEERATAA